MISSSLTFGETVSHKQPAPKAGRKHVHPKPLTHDIPLVSLASSSALQQSEPKTEAQKAQPIHYTSFPSDLRNQLAEAVETPDSFESRTPSVHDEASTPAKDPTQDEVAPSPSASSKASLHTPETPKARSLHYESFPAAWLNALPTEPEEEIPAEEMIPAPKKPEPKPAAQNFSMASLIQTPLQWLYNLKDYFFASKPSQ